MRRGEGGFILVEASITYIVLSLALVALLPLFILSIRANVNTQRIAVATQLATELLEEIRLRRWAESTPKPARWIKEPGTIGRESGELSADKKTFDDADDFHGWTEAQPLDPVMRPLPGFELYSREATVEFVDAAGNPAAGPTDYKKATACVRSPKMNPLCLWTLLTNR